MRFVVQHHICVDNHYDFMIEQGETLLTWRISINDLHQMEQGKEVKAEKIQNHRKEYLEYEGPVSGGRGEVSIYDNGDYMELSRSENEKLLFLKGSVLNGNLLIKDEENIYRFSFIHKRRK